MNIPDNKLNNKTNQLSISKLFEVEYDAPFILLIISLIFASFRPDRLLPGGKVLMYFPTIIVVILFFYWLKTPQKTLNNYQTKLFIAFVILMALHVPFVRNYGFAKAIFKGFFIYGVTSFLFTVQFINTPGKIIKYIKLMVILNVFVAVLGILGKGKVNLPVLGDENDFCLLMNICLPFAYFLGQQEENKSKKFLYYAIAGIFIMGNIASFSRGGFLGLVAVGLYMFYKSKRKAAAIVIMLVFGLVIFFAAPQTYWDEMNTIKTEGSSEGTGKERIESWKAGWKMFLDYPLFGVGPGNFGPWFPDYYPFNPGKMWGRVAHSLYFTLIPEMGLIGIFLFIGMLRGNYKDHSYISSFEEKNVETSASLNYYNKDFDKAEKTIKTLQYLSMAYFGAMLAYLATGTFISVLWYSYFWQLTAFWIVTANAARQVEKKLYAIK